MDANQDQVLTIDELRKERPAYLESGGERKLDVVYKQTPEGDLRLDLYYPTTKPDSPSPVIVYTHGGGWAAGSKQGIANGSFAVVFQKLLDHGFAVAFVNYRLCKPNHSVSMRDCVIDSKDAVRYLAKNSDTLKLDRKRFFAMGDSAGGQIAQMLTLTSPESLPGDEALRGVSYKIVAGVSWYGPFDFEKTDLFNHDDRADIRDRFGARIPKPDSDPADKLALYREVKFFRRMPAYVVCGMAVLAQIPRATAVDPPITRPNVIVIYTDDQGYGDASCYNAQSKFPTPSIDRLAAEGMRFTDGHCSDTVCTPSRYGLLTGRYSWRTPLKQGVFGAERTGLITDGRMTIASLLRDQGYATAMVGKWHLGMDFPGEQDSRDWSRPVRDMPLDKGFDYFFGVPASLNYGVLAWFEGRYAKVPPTLFTKKKPNDLNPGDYRIMPPYETTLSPDLMEVAPDFVDGECLTRFTDKAIEWVKDHAAAARADKPFLLYLPYTSPHLPVIPLEQFRGKSGCGAYGDFVMETDWHIGRLLATLDEEQLARDTFVFFSSDNGPENPWKQRIDEYQHSSSGPYRDGKRSIYDGGHRVPFIVRWPAQVKAGSVWNEPVCQTDLLATLADLLGRKLPPSAGEDSVSFLAALTGKTPEPRAPLIHHASNGRFAIREGRWKLVMEHGPRQRELYDLNSDPGEKENAIARHEDLATSLAGKITAIVQNGRSTTGPVQSNDTAWWSDLQWIPGGAAENPATGEPKKPRKNKK